MNTLSNDKIINIYNGYTVQSITFFTTLYQKGLDNHEFKSFAAKSKACAIMSALDGVIGYIALDNTLTMEQSIIDFDEVFINQYINKTCTTFG